MKSVLSKILPKRKNVSTMDDFGKSLEQFAINLYRCVQPLDGVAAFENIFFCPFTLYVLLGVTMTGARSITKKEIATVLGLSDTDNTYQQMQALCTYFKQHVEENGDSLLKMCSRILVEQNKVLRKSFIQQVDMYPHMSLSPTKLGGFQPQTVVDVNNWFKRHSEDNFFYVVTPDDLSETKRVFLTDGTLIQVIWDQEFKRELMKPADFTTIYGYATTVTMMSSTRKVSLSDIPQAEATMVVMKLKDSKWTIRILVPKKKDGFPMMLGKLFEGDNFTKLMKSDTIETLVKLQLPKFNLGATYTMHIKEALKELGMKSAFAQGEAVIPDICQQNVCLGDLFCTSKVQISEEGGEYVEIELDNTEDGTPIPEVTVDRPFVVVVADHECTPLCIGQLTCPNSM